MTTLPALVMFDLDKTLARSKQPLMPPMSVLIGKLLERTKVAIVSGGGLAQFQEQVVAHLTSGANLERLYLLPTSGAALYEYKDGSWVRVYEEKLTDAEMAEIDAAIRVACEQTGLIDLKTPKYGEYIEHRGAQVTLSALGQQAPIAEKEVWDPDASKKHILRDAIAAKLHAFDVKVGGSTSVDVTKQGVNKSYGVKKLSEHLSLPIDQMLYIGDALFPGGNDEVVKESGIRTKPVIDPDDTARVIEELLTQ